ncbi:hypothetical protein D9758_014206 [Tetrapyrgos nigripes]|uniref:ER-bound oxygenase mpaB/mpaB'/Rubber oxygenase catalytic domain-containing protein n=1 Tax=Tetrapyrgos nigripes TaxID=182062 RepID=A0A8H5CWP0_9AGAR|nr:hypothetical protein D9758_014206 [Tetrapyrgos nigripes]
MELIIQRYTVKESTMTTLPSISKILKGTKEMGSKESISKRFADTEILISTVLACPITGRSGATNSTSSSTSAPKHGDLDAQETALHWTPTKTRIDDPRAMIAIARVNWLHDKYPIKNEDHLYTLSLAMFEPERWAKKYGWRELSALECHAFFVFWAEIGRRMGIKDIPETAEEFKEWSLNYQQSSMIPSQSNYDVANITLEEFISILPNRFGIRSFAKRIAISLLEDRLDPFTDQTTFCYVRYDPQPQYIQTLIESFLRFIHFIQLYLCLPRSSPTGPVDSKLPNFAFAHAFASGKCPYNQGSGGGCTDDESSLIHAHSHSPEFMELGGKEHVDVLSNPSTKLEEDMTHLETRMHPNSYQRRPWYRKEGQGLFGKLGDRMNVWIGIWAQAPGRELRSGGYKLEEMGPLKYENEGHEDVIREAERLLGAPITGPWKAYY